MGRRGKRHHQKKKKKGRSRGPSPAPSLTKKQRRALMRNQAWAPFPGGQASCVSFDMGYGSDFGGRKLILREWRPEDGR